MILPAISLWQPWASLLFSDPPAKVHETRHWPAPYRVLGHRVAIHAAARPVSRDLDLFEPGLEALCADRFGSDWRHALPRGAFVGTAMLAACTRMGECAAPAEPDSEADRISGHWAPDRWAWRLEDRRRLPNPIPGLGRQGWFSIDLPENAL